MLHIHIDCRLNFLVKLDTLLSKLREHEAPTKQAEVHTYTEENVTVVGKLPLSQEGRRTPDIERDWSLPVLCRGYYMPRFWSEASEQMPLTRAE